MMSIFDEMLKENAILRFLEKLEKSRGMRPEDMQRHREYFCGDEFRQNIESLKDGDYYISVPVKHYIKKYKTQKMRVVYVFEEKERLLIRYMNTFLHIYDGYFSDSLLSFCRGRSVIREIKALNRLYRYDMDYVFKLDVSSYGISIDPDKLVIALRKIVDDSEVMNFFAWLLERQNVKINNEIVRENTGSIPGIAIHAFFLNVYLDDMDKKYEKIAKLYSRYADDIFMLFGSASDAKNTAESFIKELRERNLDINTKKTNPHTPCERFSFLGFEFLGDGNLDIAAATFKKMKRKIKIWARRFEKDARNNNISREDAVRKFYLRINAVFYGDRNRGGKQMCYAERYFPIITVSKTLKEIDLYVEQYARFVYYGNFAKKNYRLNYEMLKELGHKSLVRAYYDYRKQKEQEYKNRE